MSGNSGSPKGYSVPRHELKAASKHCQHCQSTEHWSFECPDKASAKKSSATARGPKLSASLLLKYGIQKKKILFEPEKTEAEQFNDDMKELEKQASELEKLAQPAESGPESHQKKHKHTTTAKKEARSSDDDDDVTERDVTAP